MSKVQNNEQSQKSDTTKEKEIIRNLLKFSGNSSESVIRRWLTTAESQDLFDLATVFVDYQRYPITHLSDKMATAIVRFSDDYVLLYSSGEDCHDKDQAYIRSLVSRFGKPKDGWVSIRYYCGKIFEDKGLDGLGEIFQLISGANQYVARTIMAAANSFLEVLCDLGELTPILESFAGDIVRTYALLAIIDAASTLRRECGIEPTNEEIYNVYAILRRGAGIE